MEVRSVEEVLWDDFNNLMAYAPEEGKLPVEAVKAFCEVILESLASSKPPVPVYVLNFGNTTPTASTHITSV
jgi:hypothetical protein